MHHLKELTITTNTPTIVHFGSPRAQVQLAVMSAATVFLTEAAVVYLQCITIAVCLMPLATICIVAIASKLTLSLRLGLFKLGTELIIVRLLLSTARSW